MKQPICILTLLLLVCTSAESADLPAQLAGRGMWLQTPDDFELSKLNDLKRMGVRRVHVMVTREPPRSRRCDRDTLPKLTVRNLDRLDQVVRGVAAAGFVTLVTVYVAPNRSSVEYLTAPDESGILNRLVGAGASGVEYDLEGGWSESAACGYASHMEAAKALFDRTKALKEGLAIGITTHLSRARDPKIPIHSADWVSLQAYTRCNRKECPSFADSKEGPGGRQLRVADALKSYRGPIVVGLAAYDQLWNGHTVNEAMALALNATKAVQRSNANVVGHSYWSTFWALQNSAERAFLLATAND